ncbi:MAG: bifunctional riboflavin kinase/FAD synthetase [Phycisphaerae bacterium]|nr:bifunctional riboflavin kinase/FAD synthetase [Phycisphaerae bacterium]
MRVYRDIASVDDAMRGAVLAVGNFDGVHLGHQRILRTAHALATVSSTAVIVMTFEPHPLAVLRPDHAPERLTPWDEKLRQLRSAGADAIVRLEATQPVLSLSAEDFVREILVQRIHPSYIVEGPSFGFGRNRAGNVDLLDKMSTKGGFQVHVVEPYRLTLGNGDHAVISSTVVRKLLKTGLVDDAAACLGRPYSLVGTVVHGAAAGRHLGFPTMNLDVGEQLVPSEGVYAGMAEVAGHRKAAAISIGQRPTLGGSSVVVEAFVLDDSGDWYGAPARLDLIKRIRDQMRFDGREALTAQIARDVEAIRGTILK